MPDPGNVPATGPVAQPDFNSVREFFENKQPPRPMAPPMEKPTGEFPHTLDLRRQMEF
jgi:hypothetical protein